MASGVFGPNGPVNFYDPNACGFRMDGAAVSINPGGFPSAQLGSQLTSAFLDSSDYGGKVLANLNTVYSMPDPNATAYSPYLFDSTTCDPSIFNQ